MSFNLGRYFQYDDSSLYIWRKGTADDPYVDKSDTVKVINNRFALDEVPDDFNRSQVFLLPDDHDFTQEQLEDIDFLEDEESIEELSEIDTRTFSAPATPAENQFIMNYSNGIGTVHSKLNGKNLVCIYKGRGKILIPAWRIWVNADNPFAVQNLDDLIEQSIKEQKNLDQKMDDFYIYMDNIYDWFSQHVNLKYEELMHLRFETLTALERTNSAADYAFDKGDYAKEQGDILKEYIFDTEILLEDILKTKDEILEDLYNVQNDWIDELLEVKVKTLEAKDEALDAADDAYYAYNTTIMIYQEPVDSYPDINAVYDDPEIGWTVVTLDDGKRYRYNGAEWKQIDNFTVGAIPTVSEDTNGLMRSEDYKYYQDLRIRSIVFVVPGELIHGEQDIVIPFPINGTIKKVKAILKNPGATDSEFDVLKISEYEYESGGSWSSILENNLILPQYENFVSVEEFDNNEVEKNDYFKIYVNQNGEDAYNLTIKIDVEIK